MNELSLFTGAGGGLLGTKLLGWRPVGYVEWEPYCQAIIAQRIRDGFLEEAPIFGDIREFVKSGAAREYRGFADVVTGGFPCQDVSVAGAGAGLDGERSGLWTEFARVVCEVRPRHVLVENSPMLTARGLGRVLGDLASLGYDARWMCLSAAECGAPHIRDRIWIVAHASGIGHGHPEDEIRPGRYAAQLRGEDVSDSDQCQRESGWAAGRMGRQPLEGSHARARIAGGTGWPSEPGLGRMAHGVADRVERLAAIGNGQVPAVVVRAWTELAR